MTDYTVLFARQDSSYKDHSCFDVYDIDRDARTYHGNKPVIAHPPCRAWGQLSHMANPREGEKELIYFALAQVRLNGGILEHPKSSRIWKTASLTNEPDKFGGFTLDIDQWDFGHVAHKDTRLYIKGITKDLLPPLPPTRGGTPLRSICGNVKNTTRCTNYQREYTPEDLITFFKQILQTIEEIT